MSELGSVVVTLMTSMAKIRLSLTTRFSTGGQSKLHAHRDAAMAAVQRYRPMTPGMRAMWNQSGTKRSGGTGS